MLANTTPPRILTLILLTAFSTLSLNMFIPSLANIASELKTDYSTVSFAVTGYLGISAIILLIVGPLSDRFGRRRVILVAIALFTCASVVCALTKSIWVFLSFRMLQGCIVSGYTLSIAIVRDTTPERQTAGLIGYISMTMAIAPMLGPILGGALDVAFGWRANFHFYAFVGLSLLVICWIDLGETLVRNNIGSEQKRGSIRSLLREPRFWSYALCSAFSTGSFYVFLVGAPLVAKSTFQIDSAELGIYIGSITAGFIFGGFLAGKLAPKYPLTTMMLAGRFIACTGLLVGFGFLLLGLVSPITYFGSTIFVGLGNGITTPSSNTGAISTHPGLSGSAAGISGALSVAGGSILTMFAGILMTTENIDYMLLSIMFATAFLGLLAAFWALRLERMRTSSI